MAVSERDAQSNTIKVNGKGLRKVVCIRELCSTMSRAIYRVIIGDGMLHYVARDISAGRGMAGMHQKKRQFLGASEAKGRHGGV